MIAICSVFTSVIHKVCTLHIVHTGFNRLTGRDRSGYQSGCGLRYIFRYREREKRREPLERGGEGGSSVANPNDVNVM